MTLNECLEAAAIASTTIVCNVSSSSWIGVIASGATILSSAAIIAAAAFAWHQLQLFKSQMTSGADNHLSRLLADKDLAVSQISANSANIRLRATLDLLIHIQSNSHWAENRAKFIALRDSKEGLEKHAGEDTEECAAIRKALNQYELIAIGIRLQIIDREMFRNFYRSTVVRDYLGARNFIQRERNDGLQNKKYWCEFELLATQFENEPIT